MILVKVSYGFSWEERGKENNTYFIDVFEIENVEVRRIENG